VDVAQIADRPGSRDVPLCFKLCSYFLGYPHEKFDLRVWEQVRFVGAAYIFLVRGDSLFNSCNQ